ncbi:hypothetical protein CLJU_c03290 [Clostridium ljungdahlii DSM 13528]|jgi:hypothetical protein|uniref:Uncharacterized protein n=1 Tax=Clostridium ljungdahlii (strain ATCC 55383 / DSM 13528 / PETC) TaxID=748727 RepID=D8GLL5_CLOLD|nr:hypothetical protein CLJU_c03290 [Clostridium ljungdahlii DSM 13528]
MAPSEKIGKGLKSLEIKGFPRAGVKTLTLGFFIG